MHIYLYVYLYIYVGLTLTRSHTVVLLDRPWTPGDTAQAEDRVRRIGQVSIFFVLVYMCIYKYIYV